MFATQIAMLVLAAAGFANAAPAVDADAAKRLFTPEPLTLVKYCVNVGMTGDCAYSPLTVTLDACVDMPAAYNDRISGFQPLLPATVCTLYTDVGCAGMSITVDGPDGNADLNAAGFADVTSSYKCTLLGDTLDPLV